MNDKAYGFNANTAAHTAAYFVLKANRQFNATALSHWLYLAERHHAKTHGHTIFADFWLATPLGPVCHDALRGLLGISDNAIWPALFLRPNDGTITCRAGVTVDDLDYLSEAIVKTTDTLIGHFGAMSECQISNWMLANLPENEIFASENREITAQAMALSIGLNPAEFVETDAEDRSIETSLASS